MMLAMAWRNLWRNKARSFIIIASVVIGLFAGIFVLGLYAGMLRNRIRTVIDREVAHLQIHAPHFKGNYDPNFVIEDLDRIETTLRSTIEIRKAAFRTVTQGMLASSTGSAGVEIYGIIPEEENLVSQQNKKIIEGTELSIAKKNGIIIGKKLSGKMKLKLGSKLVVTFTDKENNITAGAFRVMGIYQTDNTPLDERQVYVNRATLNSYLGIGKGIHEVAIILNHDEDVNAVKLQLQNKFPKLFIETWTQISPETDLMVSTVAQYSLIIIGIIMIALAFGIINTMLMAVLERTHELGMLLALGMNRPRLFSLIMIETVILTITGAPFGILIAWSIINYFSKSGIDISSFAGQAMSGFGYSSVIFPEFPQGQIFSVLIVVICTALVSSLFPSLKAIKMEPADALRL